MEFTVKRIAELLNGDVEGDPDRIVTTLSKIEEGKSGALAFLSNPLYNKFIYETKASVVIVSRKFIPERAIETTIIRVDDPYQSFATLLEIYYKMISDKKGIDSQAFIDKSVQLGENVYIGAFAYLSSNVKIGKNVKIYPHVYLGDNVEIGDNTVLRSGVKVYRDCKIGSDCILHSSVVIGGDGFGFAPKEGCNYKKVPQVGNVIIEEYVEIGANTTIDRATLGSTIIRKGVKLDNLIQIAHNVEIGENTVIAAQTGVSGSTKVGRNCMIGGQVGIVGHITIADNVKIAAQSGVGTSITNQGEIVQGSPAFKVHSYQRSYVAFKYLPELRNQILQLQKELEELKTKL